MSLAIQGALNRIAGTDGYGEQAAANAAIDRVAAIAAGGGGSFGGGVQTGNYYVLNSPRSANTNAISQSALRVFPVAITKQLVIDTLSVDVITGAASSKVRIVVYASNAAGDNAGALLYDSGQIASATSATVVEATGVALTLDPGVYWFGTVSQDGAPTLGTAGTGGSHGASLTLGASLPASGSLVSSCMSQASVTGAPPDPYAGSYSNGQCARIIVKVG